MTNYREILRLSSLGLNKTQIAQSIGCSRTTVIQVPNIAEEKGVCYPLPQELTDRKLAVFHLAERSRRKCNCLLNHQLGTGKRHRCQRISDNHLPYRRKTAAAEI